MSNKPNPGFNLLFPENLKKADANLSPTKQLSFDDLGDFIEEREKIKRVVENSLETNLKIDYSQFSNHVFFDSAVSKFAVAKDRILNRYPYNGNKEQKDAFHLTSSGYEDYVFESWPKHVGYLEFNGINQYVSASDPNNKLVPVTSSLYISTWLKNPKVTSQNMILQVVSASSAPIKKYGYELYLSGANAPYINFSMYSGSQKVTFSAPYSSYTGSVNNVAVLYDRPSNILSLYVNDRVQVTGNVNLNSLEFSPIVAYVGSGSQHGAASASFDFYSGSLDEVRIAHTASDIYHKKNYGRPIDAESFVKLHYKFNEGITGTGSIDSIVVDYSKSGIHGKIINYTSSVRVSGTTMFNDYGDPILYSFHSGVMAFTSSIDLTASIYDINNNNNIFNLVPEVAVNEDPDGLFASFALAMSRFFDELKLYIDQFDNLRITNYDGVNETPDLMLPLLTKYFGWKVTDHFGDTDALPFFFGENVLASGSMDIPLLEIRNQFWRRILNNLPYLLKTKGKRNNLDAFFNVLGVNQNNFSVKEYGYLPGNSIANDRINKQKPVAVIGIGTGSIPQTGSYVIAPSLIGSTKLGSNYTVETLVQLPYNSASYSASLTTGSIWQFVTSDSARSFTLAWVRSLNSDTGKFLLTGSDGQSYSTTDCEVFNGDFIHLAAGLNNARPFVQIRTLDTTNLKFSASFAGVTALSGVFTGSNYNFVMGANFGTNQTYGTHGFFSEYRVWNRVLSGSELDDHAYNFQSVGVADPSERPNPLLGHWSLNENTISDESGKIHKIQDYSRNGNIATGSLFPAGENAYQKFLFNYNYLSPSIDLKWTDNKIRIRNKTELTINDVASDTNEVSLEFNLVDSLNEDISKIFSSFDVLNQVIGKPVNKYRDEYSDLENIRRVYFDRLGDSLNFTNFFKLFRWFDKKLSDSIKQLLPARVKFIGGEQVVESHFLERPKYGYKYPVFRTPKPIPEITASISPIISSSLMEILKSEASALGTYSESYMDRGKKYVGTTVIKRRESVITPDAYIPEKFISVFSDGNDRNDRSLNQGGHKTFYRVKVSGDQSDTINLSNTDINSKNEWAVRKLIELERDNKDTTTDNTGNIFVNKKIGNGFLLNAIDSSKNQNHYFSNAKKHLPVRAKLTHTGSNEPSPITLNGPNATSLAGPGAGYYALKMYDATNTSINDISWSSIFGISSFKFRKGHTIQFRVSASNVPFNRDDIYAKIYDNILDLNQEYIQFTVEDEPDNWKLCKYQFQGTIDTNVYEWPSGFLANSIFEVAVGPVTASYVFKDVEIHFDQELTDSGVEYFKSLSNDNIDKISYFVNRDVNKSIGNEVLGNSFTQFYHLYNSDNRINTLYRADEPRKNNGDGTYSSYQYIYGMMAVDSKSKILYTLGAGSSQTPIRFFVRAANLNFPENLTKIDTYEFLTGNVGSDYPYFIKVNPYNGYVYYSAFSNGHGILRYSSTPLLSQSYQTIDSLTGSRYWDIAFSGSAVYCCVETGSFGFGTAKVLLRMSETGQSGTFITVNTYSTNNPSPRSMTYRDGPSNGTIFVCGAQTPSNITGSEWFTLRYSLNDHVPVLVDTYMSGPGEPAHEACKIYALPYNSGVYVAGYSTGPNGVGYANVRRSLTGLTGSFTTIDSMPSGSTLTGSVFGLFADDRERVFYGHAFSKLGKTGFRIRSTGINGATPFQDVYIISGNLDNSSGNTTHRALNMDYDEINKEFYCIVAHSGSSSNGSNLITDPNGPNGFFPYLNFHVLPYSLNILKGKIIDNNTSFGSRMFSNYIEYPVQSSSLNQYVKSSTSPDYITRKKLLNISEFSAYNKNAIVGTISSGKIGTKEDDLINIRHIGSVVYIVWPKQDITESSVGFGDLSAGQKIGSLTTTFSVGDTISVENFDHMSLYCYLLKDSIGTVDSVEIKIERRPIKSAGFATEQLIEYGNSGSLAIAELKDLIYKKQIDYSDLSIKEIGFPIDVPLTNTKEIRISARQSNGQSMPNNRNLIIWARLIKSKEET